MHRIITRQSVTMYPRTFAEEIDVVECLKTDKWFSMRVTFYCDNETGYYTIPKNEYSYCPHCGAKLDLWEGRE